MFPIKNRLFGSANGEQPPPSSNKLHHRDLLSSFGVSEWVGWDSNPLTASPLREFVNADWFYRPTPLPTHKIKQC